jgi:hypothetical protein
MRFVSDPILSGQSMAADFETEAIKIELTYGFSFQAVFTGAPVGVFILQASNDVSNPTNWDDIPSSAQLISAAGSIMWNYNGAFYRWVRVFYDRTSGTGSCNIVYSSKGA